MRTTMDCRMVSASCVLAADCMQLSQCDIRSPARACEGRNNYTLAHTQERGSSEETEMKLSHLVTFEND